MLNNEIFDVTNLVHPGTNYYFFLQTKKKFLKNLGGNFIKKAVVGREIGRFFYVYLFNIYLNKTILKNKRELIIWKVRKCLLTSTQFMR